MKKAEDLCKELNWICGSDPGRHSLFIGLLEPIIKLAQEDAIRETAKKCVENVETYEYPYMDSCPSCGHTATYVDMGSILSVADKLIKEL